MITPTELKYHLASAEELQSLYDQHGFDAKLSTCRQIRVAAIPQDKLHETFCCKKELVQFIDPSTDDEIARTIEQTYVNPAKARVRILRRLRIGNDVHDLRIPL